MNRVRVADSNWMAQAFRFARRGIYTTRPNPRVGCVIVKNNTLIGKGWHERAGSFHAEINALEEAGNEADSATLYVTLEPCSHYGRTPPCVHKIIEQKIKRVVIANIDPNPVVEGRGVEALRSAGIDVSVGVLKEEGALLNPGFFSRMKRKRPYVWCKQAISLDGKTAMANGESQWITGEMARRDGHRLRARCCAVMTGVDSVIADDPLLNVRESLFTDEGDPIDMATFDQPARVVLDTDLRMPINSKLMQTEGRTVILSASDDQQRTSQIKVLGKEVYHLPKLGRHLDLDQLMAYLAGLEMNEILLESGSRLSGAMLKMGLVDKLIVYMTPKVMGNQSMGMFEIPELVNLADSIQFEIDEVRAIGNDLKITLFPK